MGQFLDANIKILADEFHNSHPDIFLEVVQRGNAYFVRIKLPEVSQATVSQPGIVNDIRNVLVGIRNLTHNFVYLEAV